MAIKLWFAAFKKLPIVGRIATFLSDKKRLIVSYILLGVCVSCAGLAFALYLTKKELKGELSNTRGELTVVKQRLSTEEFKGQVQEGAIKILAEQRANDSAALGGLLEDFGNLASDDAETQRKLVELEKRNEAVRNLRAQPVPPEYACLLEPRSCKAGNSAGPGN